MKKTIKVTADSNPSKIGGVIAHSTIFSDDSLELQAIGNKAIAQAIKSIAIARDQMSVGIFCIPYFIEAVINGKERTGVRLIIKREGIRWNTHSLKFK